MRVAISTGGRDAPGLNGVIRGAIRRSEAAGRHFSIVVVAEGARTKEGDMTVRAFDGLRALQFGAQAVRAVEQRRFGEIVAYTPPSVSTVPLDDALAKPKLVPLDGDTINTARDLGISLGE